MSYSLHVTPEAEDDLRRMLEHYPSGSRRRTAALETAAALQRLTVYPSLAAGRTLGRPTFHFSFRANGVGHHWAAVFQFSEDEKYLIVLQIYRVAV